MSLEPKWNVIVVGGFGFVGRQIALDLKRTLGVSVRLTLAGRTINQGFARELGCDALRFDINDPQAGERLKGFCFAIIAAGPTPLIGARAAKVCIEAGVPCLDINDSIEATQDILALDALARERGVDVFTGFGLLPGLSTLLLQKLTEQGPGKQPIKARLRLYMGAKTAGGPASGFTLASNFRDRTSALRSGKTVWSRSSIGGNDARFAFPGLHASVGTLPFSSPESVTVIRSPLAARLQELDVRYHVQFMPNAMARFGLWCSRLNYKGGDALIARMMAAGGPSAARRRKSTALTSLVAESSDGRRVSVHGDYPAPSLTAAFASAATVLILRNGLSLQGGVFSFENIQDRLPSIGVDLLRRGIVLSANADDTPSSPASGTSEDMRHFGRCWYDVKPPAEIQAMQLQSLKDSAFWKAIQSEIRPLKRAELISKFLLQWRKCASLARAHLRKHSDSPPIRTVARDLGMFAAGYGLSRSVFGQQKALPLYRQMFLETAEKEMDWLWPAGAIFTAHDDGAKMFARYINAYFDAYRRLKIYSVSSLLSDVRLEITLERCAFADTLVALGVGEIADLIREMELAAIRKRAVPLGLEVSWQPGNRIATGTLSLIAAGTNRSAAE